MMPRCQRWATDYVRKYRSIFVVCPTNYPDQTQTKASQGGKSLTSIVDGRGEIVVTVNEAIE